MKKSLIRLLLVLLALSSCAQARPVILEPGTEVLIRVVDRIKSNKVKNKVKVVDKDKVKSAKAAKAKVNNNHKILLPNISSMT